MRRPNYRRQIQFTPSQMAANCVTSTLSNLMYEVRDGAITEESLLISLAEILIDIGADSRTVVDILERDAFKEHGEEIALGIKIREGW